MPRQFSYEFGRGRKRFIGLNIKTEDEMVIHPFQGTFSFLMFGQQIAPVADMLLCRFAFQAGRHRKTPAVSAHGAFEFQVFGDGIDVQNGRSDLELRGHCVSSAWE